MSRISTWFVITLIVAITHLGMTAPSALANHERRIEQLVEYCEASWYGPGLNGNPMSGGGQFDMHDPTVVAHKTLPFGTILIITNLRNDAVMAVEVQDDGPHIEGRCVDLSYAGAQALGFYCGPRCGTTDVRVDVCLRECPEPGTLLREPEQPTY